MGKFLSGLFRKNGDEAAPHETEFEAKFDQEKQKVGAMKMVAAGFESKGGPSLMLTEAVENGADAIIKLRERLPRHSGKIHVLISEKDNTIIVTDNGTGFVNVKHVCEKPFDSLKESDSTQTGQFARGLQGFRAFCKTLRYITRRQGADIPRHEQDAGIAGTPSHTVQVRFEDNSSRAKVKYVPDEDFRKYSLEEQGTIAIYEGWKPGQFDKLNVTDLVRRLQHHFGELIRQGDIEILVGEVKGKIQGIGPEQARSQVVEPRDYSDFNKLEVPPIPYIVNGKKSGQISFNLYLCERGKRSRWNQPFLLHNGRPVGDGFIAEIDEFSEDPIWKSKFLTGYITCDFCEINELRQGLRINSARDFLYSQLSKIQKRLEKDVKAHSRGLYELKLQKQVNEMVRELQDFFRNKKIFDFKKAKSTGFLSHDKKEIDIVTLSEDAGSDDSLSHQDNRGDAVRISTSATYKNVLVNSEENGTAHENDPSLGGKGGTNAETKTGSPGDNARAAESGASGYEKSSDSNIHKPSNSDEQNDESKLSEGGNQKSKKKGRRPKARGFGMTFIDDEWNDEMSWFDPLESMIVINSLHPRFVARNTDEKSLKDLMKYLSELYIWEITKLVHSKDEDIEKGDRFLSYKFEYLEKQRAASQAGN